MKTYSLKSLFLLLSFCLSTICFAQNPVLKIDLNTGQRSQAEVNERNYTPWPIKGGQTDQATYKGIKITFTKIGEAGSELTAAYFKTGVQAPY